MANEGRVQQLIEIQFDLHRRIARAFENMKKLGSAKINRAVITARAANLQTAWSKFEANHDLIVGGSDEAVRKSDYFVEDLFEKVEEEFLKQNSKFAEELESHPVKSSGEAKPDAAVQAELSSRSLLKHLDLPTFSGHLPDWPRFKDLFVSMIKDVRGFSDVQKLQYLMGYVTGEAAAVLANIKVSGDNFAGAWQLLIDRYENKRLLAEAYLTSLTDIAVLKNNSAGELARLVDGTCGVVKAMEALEMPIDAPDCLLVHITVQKLDPTTMEDWEMSIGASSKYPTFKELCEFLNTQIRGRRAVESKLGKLPSVKDTKLRTVKTHVVSTGAGGSHRGRCVLCKGDHYVAFCENFKAKTPASRKQWAQANDRCFNCLGKHRLRDCPSEKRCQKCSGQHHTSLHDAFLTSSGPSPLAATHVTHTKGEEAPSVLVATARVRVLTVTGEKILARALIDPGSEVSLITEALAQKLRLLRRSGSVSILGVGGESTRHTRGRITVALHDHQESRPVCLVDALVLPRITKYQPKYGSLKVDWSHLKGLTLADPWFQRTDPIDLLLGADIHAVIIREGLRKGHCGAPVGQETSLGWILSGVIGRIHHGNPTVQHVTRAQDESELTNLLRRFWEQEKEDTATRLLTTEEEAVERFFQRTYSRNQDGRYVVRLPTKSNVNSLGYSRTAAMSALLALERRFARGSMQHELYANFLQEYEQLGHMVEIAPEEADNAGTSFYLPHHGVLKDEKGIRKIRVVFNGSRCTRGGPSLNEVLHSGPNLLPELAEILCRWRMPRVVFSADIEKMYRQIEVHPEDQRLQLILWRRNTNDRIRTFRLRTVTYGLTCAPYLAIRTLHQLAEDEGQRFPLAAEALGRITYMDDLLAGADTLSDAQELKGQLIGLCKAGGFPLRKWTASERQLLRDLPEEHAKDEPTLSWDAGLQQKMLGLHWLSREDAFHFQCELAPVTTKAKIFMQQLWLLKLGWDEALPMDLQKGWSEFCNGLAEINAIRVPRWVHFSPGRKLLEMHGFSDASEVAYASCVYLRVVDSDGKIHVSLRGSKTKVAPLKKLSLPRLELCAAHQLTKLIAKMQKILNLDDVPVHLWTDSTIVLGWIQCHPSRWTTFVANRVTEIQTNLPTASWHHISTHDNRADCASRGISAREMHLHPLWWQGPALLRQDDKPMPPSSLSQWSQINLESKETKFVLHSQTKTEECPLLLRYSKLSRLLRVTAWCLRFVDRTRGRKESNVTFPETLQPRETDKANNIWVRISQEHAFAAEIAACRARRPIPSKSPLLRLDPFLDEVWDCFELEGG